MSHPFYIPPRVQPYDPIPSHSELTVMVERQRQDRDNLVLGMVESEPTGRVRIVVEGVEERVAPYLAAVLRVVEVEA